MGIRYRCDADLGCTFIVWDADVTVDEWDEQERRLFSDPAFPPGPRAIADLRTAGGVPDIPMEVVEEMARHLRDHAPQIGELLLAIVPNSGWEKAQQFEVGLVGSGIRAISFANVGTACVWLGIDGDAALASLDALRDEIRA